MEEVLKKCPRCKKSNIRYRLKLKEYVCNVCGNVWKLGDND